MLRTIRLGIRTVSEANRREHWHVASARHKQQKMAVALGLYAMNIPKDLPVKITLTRISSRKMDDDNLQTALKYIRDAVAEYFIPGKAVGRADDDPRLSWHYAQAKEKEMAIQFSFEWTCPSTASQQEAH